MPKEIAFTQEIQDKICELLASHSMDAICNMEGMPCKATIHKWYDRFPEFHTACRRARDLCADSLLDEHAKIMEQLATGVLESDQARVLLNGLQWRIIMLDKARYGDKPTKLTINNNTDNRRVDVTFEALKLAPSNALKDLKRQITAAHETEELTPN